MRHRVGGRQNTKTETMGECEKRDPRLHGAQNSERAAKYHATYIVVVVRLMDVSVLLLIRLCKFLFMHYRNKVSGP
jgi:hypothetical protein